jgi:predicted DNA-binding transcriptional regulator AlpA
MANEDGKWVGLVEIAALLGLGRSTIRTMKTRGQLPEPTFTIASGPVWRKTTIDRWIKQRNK